MARRSRRVRQIGTVDLGRRAVDGAAVDAGLAVRISAEHGAVAQQVDAPRHTARPALDALQRAGVERRRAGEPGHGQPVRDVLAGLGRRQRLEVKARDHPLRQLLEFRTRQHRAQFGLADQDDLQQLALAGLQVRQQAQLLEHVGRQVLRLVDDEHAGLAERVRPQHEIVERIEVVLDAGRAVAGARNRDAEFFANRLQQLGHAELGVEDVGDVAALRNLLQEAAAHGGLAGADLAAEQHEAAAALQPVQQVRQRFAVALAHEQEARVGSDRERLSLQTEIRRVHADEDSPASAGAAAVLG